MSKVKSYIGFAIRSREIVLGVNAIEITHKNFKLFLMCRTAQKNTVKQAISLSKKRNVKIIVTTKENLADFVHKENCKLAGVLNQELAKAIINNMNDDFVEFKEDVLIERKD